MPVAIGIATLMLCYVVLFAMPECQGDSSSIEIGHTKPASTSYGLNPAQNSDRISGVISRAMLAPDTDPLVCSRNIVLAFPIFLVGVFRGISIRVLLQYTSMRFDWKLSQVGNLILRKDWAFVLRDSETNGILSEVALVNLFLFSLILPYIMQLLKSSTSLSLQDINLKIIQCSLIILATGSILLALANSSELLVICELIDSKLS